MSSDELSWYHLPHKLFGLRNFCFSTKKTKQIHKNVQNFMLYLSSLLKVVLGRLADLWPNLAVCFQFVFFIHSRLINKQLYARTCRIRDILWYFHNEVAQYFGHRNFRSNSTFWSRGSTKRSKWKDDSLKPKWILRIFRKIGDNYNIFNLNRISPNLRILVSLVVPILSRLSSDAENMRWKFH